MKILSAKDFFRSFTRCHYSHACIYMYLHCMFTVEMSMKITPDSAKQDRGVPALQRLAAVSMCANAGGRKDGGCRQGEVGLLVNHMDVGHGLACWNPPVVSCNIQ